MSTLKVGMLKELHSLLVVLLHLLSIFPLLGQALLSLDQGVYLDNSRCTVSYSSSWAKKQVMLPECCCTGVYVRVTSLSVYVRACSAANVTCHQYGHMHVTFRFTELQFRTIPTSIGLGYVLKPSSTQLTFRSTYAT